MAEPLKLFFNRAIVEEIAGDLRRVHRAFDVRRFVTDATRGLDELELTERAHHIKTVLARHLPPRFADAARVLSASLGPRLEATEGNKLSPFKYLPHVFWVAESGLADDDVDAALALQAELTKRFSAEYSIRPFIRRHPARTFAQLHVWARDPDVHVRRLVSEGTRPRLPWAPRLPELQKDPAPALALLELLRDDPEEYVRRSVANHLNDIGKDHPALLVATARRWLADAPPERRRLVRHALRSLEKKGHPEALGLLGFGAAPRVRVEDVVVTPRRVQRGGAVELTYTLRSTAREPQTLLVDTVVGYVKASGGCSPKVFKLARLELAPRAAAPLRVRLSLRDLTTRKHHPGRHTVEAQVNGARFSLGEFHLLG